MPFGPTDAELDLPELESRVLARWRERDVVKKTAESRDGAKPWIFYEGPPTANGRPGLHHVWARVFKDLFPRFQTMRGYAVPRKGGWDCHGLPVELEIEKELGLATKADIEAYGIEAFNERCRESVQRYVEDWSSLTTRSGVWIDTADAYWTLTNDYIESVWWLVRQLWDKELLYEGHRVSPYCGRCGTALSSHEVAQGYRDVVDPSIYVRFPLTGGGAPDGADLMVWTTTPWTLISNVAAAVGPGFTYVRIAGTAADGGRDLVLLEQAAQRMFPDEPVLDRWNGAEMAGWRYERPFDFLDPGPAGADAWRVVTADFVSTDDGTGIVHIAPAFGEDDYQVSRTEGLPILNPVDADASFDHHVPPWQGRFVKDADPEIIEDLRGRGLLVVEQPYEHSYPHCWRCGTPLIYWAKTSWFVRTSDHLDDLLAQNEAIGWHPDHIKHGRFGRWLEGNVDWALSRDRYWGTPMPIWRCGEGHALCVGSVAELSQRAGRDLSELDLHRPYVDEITWTCGLDGCQATARRVLPVLDAWFDSGSMPSAQVHHPFDPEDRFERSFPADFICEAIDQTRGWFYSLLAINTLVFGSTPFRNVVVLGHIVDEAGQKMSKSKGNVIDPWQIFEGFGSDALRWYFFSAGQPWAPRRVYEDGIRESTRQTLVTLWNVFSFFATYADIDGWQPDPREANDLRPEHLLDRWALGELDDTVATVTEALDNFDALTGATRLARFVDDLSNWYVRRSRPRFWKASDPAAHATLHHCLVTTAQLLAPFCPFLADELYVTLTGETSVHLSDWPTPQGRHDPALADAVAAARRLVALGRAARTDAKVRVRQPLRRALILHPGATLDADTVAEVATELNVKELEAVEGLSGLMSWTAVPNFRALGPRLGPKVNEVKAALAESDGSVLHEQLESQGWIEVAGERLTADEVTLRAGHHESFALAEDGGWAVALDLELDDELRAEGLARELVRGLNDLRKAVGLDIADRIEVALAATDEVWSAVETHRDYVMAEVLALALTRTETADHTLPLDGTEISATLTRQT